MTSSSTTYAKGFVFRTVTVLFVTFALVLSPLPALANPLQVCKIEAQSDVVCIFQVFDKASKQRSYVCSEDTQAMKKLNDGSQNWRFEKPAWYEPPKSNTPVYRLWNKKNRSYYFTTSLKKARSLKSKGWRNQGICWYSDDAKGKPVYRLYNKKLKANSYRYTTSKSVKKNLQMKGWRYQGVGWYAVKKPTIKGESIFVGKWELTKSDMPIFGDTIGYFRSQGCIYTFTLKKDGTCIRREYEKVQGKLKRLSAAKMKWVQLSRTAGYFVEPSGDLVLMTVHEDTYAYPDDDGQLVTEIDGYTMRMMYPTGSWEEAERNP